MVDNPFLEATADDPFADLTPSQGSGSSGDPFADLTPAKPSGTTAGAFLSSKAGRFLQGAAEPAVGLAQLAAHATGYGADTMDNIAKKEADLYQASRKEAGLKDGDLDYFSGAGNVLSPVTLLPGGIMGRVAGEGATLLGMGARGAALGATYGASQPVADAKDFASQKTSQIGSGAVTGGLMGPATGVVANAVSPILADGARALLNEGVELTPGQLLGGNAKRLEDVAAKTPFVGQSVRNAQENAVSTFNTAAANRALAPIGEEVPRGVQPGHDLFNYVEDRLGTRYNDIHSRMSATVDPQFGAEAHQIMQDAMVLPPAQQSQLQAIVDNQILHKFTAAGGTIDGPTIQSIGSELKAFVRARRGDPSADAKALAGHVDDLRDSFDNMLMRQNNPADAAALRDANTGWAHLVRLEKATSASPSQAFNGRFTPTQLGLADKASSGTRQMARGNGLYQDLAEAGRSVIPSKIADSGTPERLMTHGVLGALYTGAVSPLALVPGLALPAIYSRPVQAALRAAIASRPAGADTVANILRRYAPVNTRAVMNQNGQTQ